MDDLHFSIEIDTDTELWISTISKQTFEDSELANIGDDFGYFLIEASSKKGLDVIAKFVDSEAALNFAHKYFDWFKPEEQTQ